MPRYRLKIEYDGTPFVGWQRQATGLTVQGVVEQALAQLCQSPVLVQCAGRTDAGVHASGQVAHVDLPKDFKPDNVRDGANFHLKAYPVAVIAAEPVSDDFHARFSATGRAYVYRLQNRRAPSVLEHNRAWWVPVALDEAAMAEAAQHLLGTHDFTSFRAAECQAKSPIKTLDRLDVRRDGDMIIIDAAARSFLHHQVRNMVGTLKLVGTGKWRPDQMAAALAARSRAAAGPTAPPQGLYLTEVRY